MMSGVTTARIDAVDVMGAITTAWGVEGIRQKRSDVQFGC